MNLDDTLLTIRDFIRHPKMTVTALVTGAAALAALIATAHTALAQMASTPHLAPRIVSELTALDGHLEAFGAVVSCALILCSTGASIIRPFLSPAPPPGSVVVTMTPPITAVISDEKKAA